MLKMSFKTLICAVSGQCQEIKQALALFPYFDTWESHVVAECCRVSSIVEFPPDEIILRAESENSHNVYFVLEGVCKIMQNLYVEFKIDFRGERPLKLYKFPDSTKVKIVLENNGYSSKLFNHNPNFHVGKTYEIDDCHEEIKTGFLDKAEKKIDKKLKTWTDQIQELKKKPEFNEKVGCLRRERESGKTKTTGSAEPESEVIYEPDLHVKILQDCIERRSQMTWVRKNFSKPEKPKSVKSFFIQIGLLFKGACFGLEKSEKQDFISSTKVKCLKIPQWFLLQHNPCNIWNRIRLFHRLYFPKVEKIFECFQSDRKWIERKKRQTEEIFYSNNFPNFTVTSDVPYSLRMIDLR